MSLAAPGWWLSSEVGRMLARDFGEAFDSVWSVHRRPSSGAGRPGGMPAGTAG